MFSNSKKDVVHYSEQILMRERFSFFNALCLCSTHAWKRVQIILKWYFKPFKMAFNSFWTMSFCKWECRMTWYVPAVPFHDPDCFLSQPCMYLAWTGNWRMWIITPLRMDKPNQWRSRPTLWLQFLQMVTFQGRN